MSLVTQDAIPATGQIQKKGFEPKIQQNLTSPPSGPGDNFVNVMKGNSNIQNESLGIPGIFDNFKNNDNRIAWHSVNHSHPLNNGLGDIQFGKGIPDKTQLTSWTAGDTTIDYSPITSRYNSSRIQKNLGDIVYNRISKEAQRQASGPRTAAWFSEPHIIKRPDEAPAQEGAVASAVKIVKGVADFMGVKLSLKDAYAYGRHTLSPRGILFLANEVALTKRVIGQAYEGHKTFKQKLSGYKPSAIIKKLKEGNTFNPLAVYASRTLGGVGVRGIRNYNSTLTFDGKAYSGGLLNSQDAYLTDIESHEWGADFVPHVRGKDIDSKHNHFNWDSIVTNRNDSDKWWSKKIVLSVQNARDEVATGDEVPVNIEGFNPFINSISGFMDTRIPGIATFITPDKYSISGEDSFKLFTYSDITTKRQSSTKEGWWSKIPRRDRIGNISGSDFIDNTLPGTATFITDNIYSIGGEDKFKLFWYSDIVTKRQSSAKEGWWSTEIEAIKNTERTEAKTEQPIKYIDGKNPAESKRLLGTMESNGNLTRTGENADSYKKIVYDNIVTNRNDLSNWWSSTPKEDRTGNISGSEFDKHKTLQDVTPTQEALETPFTLKATEDNETLYTRGGEELIDKYRAHLYGDIATKRNDRTKWKSQQKDDETPPNLVNIQYKYGTSGRANPGGRYEGDKINLLEIQQLKNGAEPETGVSDLIPFKIKILNTGQLIILRAFIDDISDTITPDWSEIKYVGRPDPVHVYKGATRQFTLKFKLIPFSKEEHKILWKKANTLVGLNYPSYTSLGKTEGSDGKDKTIEVSLGQRMIAPFVKLTVGDMIHDQAGYFKGINVKAIDNSPWELTPGQQLPMYIEVDATFVFVGNYLPDLANPKFYNIDRLQQ
jgi:hypothetical protein